MYLGENVLFAMGTMNIANVYYTYFLVLFVKVCTYIL